MKKPLELYIHIPFCVKKCNYCDFQSHSPRVSEIELYMEELNNTISSYNKFAKDYYLTSIFIGGGTPSIVEENHVKEMFDNIKSTFEISDACEVTIEVNPGTVTREKLTTYKHVGINRLSIGLQSTNDNELKALGRIHTYDEFKGTYHMAREVGFNNINIDLMQAIPNQTIRSYFDTLTKVINLNPEHISAYSLIIEDGTPFYKMNEEGLLKLPNEDSEREMYHTTKKMLKASGYNRYEISNYAKPGYECKHNIGYWKCSEYLGIGDSAASLIGNTRFIKSANEQQVLTKENQMEEFMFLGLRMMEGISKEDFHKRFGVNYNNIYQEITKKLVDEGLLVDRDNKVFLTERGVDISNYVMSEFLL
ncbi:MAG: radical SAM family heme chaperone HemW [Suipraeoptans sp.]